MLSIYEQLVNDCIKYHSLIGVELTGGQVSTLRYFLKYLMKEYKITRKRG